MLKQKHDNNITLDVTYDKESNFYKDNKENIPTHNTLDSYSIKIGIRGDQNKLCSNASLKGVMPLNSPNDMSFVQKKPK